MRTSAVIFDLDGTLTVPNLDFDAMRAEIGIASGPILEAIAEMDDQAAGRAHEILNRFEQRGAEDAVLQEGAAQTLAELRRRGHPLAILTRNARRWAQHVLDRYDLTIDAMRTRDDGAIKPSAHPVHSICDELAADPAASWMIGDFHFDILSGREAGTKTVLIVSGEHIPDYASQADFVIRRLDELLEIIRPLDQSSM